MSPIRGWQGLPGRLEQSEAGTDFLHIKRSPSLTILESAFNGLSDIDSVHQIVDIVEVPIQIAARKPLPQEILCLLSSDV